MSDYCTLAEVLDHLSDVTIIDAVAAVEADPDATPRAALEADTTAQDAYITKGQAAVAQRYSSRNCLISPWPA